MSNTQNFLDTKRSCKAPEKSNFASTCNLLTQYLKEKGNLKDLSRSINEKFESLGKSGISQTTETSSKKNLLNSLGDLNQPPTEETGPMDYLPQFTNVVSATNTEDCKNKANTSKEETSECKTTQMTIFYDGKVWVFDSLPAEKAQELMILASKGNNSPLTATCNLSTPSNAEKINLVAAVASTSSPAANPLVSTSGKEKVKAQSDASNSELPIARRSSLHRFLAKRKDRSTARAPYHVGDDARESSSKNYDQLELKL